MNEWLNDVIGEINQAKEDRKAQDARLEVVRQQAGRIFEQLKHLMQDAANKMQQAPEIKERVGQLETAFGYTDRIEINRRVIPAVYLTVRYGPTTIDVSRKIILDHQSTNTRDQKESLTVELDAKGNPYLKNKHDQTLLVDEAVGYILKPSIFPELLDEPNKGSGWSLQPFSR